MKTYTYDFVATFDPVDATNQAVTWSIEDDSPAGCVTVDENGSITAVEEGTATVVATSDDDDSITILFHLQRMV